MTKHVLIHNPKYNCAASIDVERFAECVRKLEDAARPLVRWPLSWFDTLLLAHTSDGRIEITPRGQDLLASIDSLPDDPKSEVKTSPCNKCNGSGEQPLFVSMETCDRCKGSQVEPHVVEYTMHVTSGRVSSSRPNGDSLPREQALGRVSRAGYSAFYYAHSDGTAEIVRTSAVGGHPWVLIDSEEVAQQFVGKRVQIETLGVFDIHPLHGSTGECVQVAGGFMVLHCAGEDYYWRLIGNVRLRLVDGDPS